jgi:hypothetical protein
MNSVQKQGAGLDCTLLLQFKVRGPVSTAPAPCFFSSKSEGRSRLHQHPASSVQSQGAGLDCTSTLLLNRGCCRVSSSFYNCLARRRKPKAPLSGAQRERSYCLLVYFRQCCRRLVLRTLDCGSLLQRTRAQLCVGRCALLG